MILTDNFNVNSSNILSTMMTDNSLLKGFSKKNVDEKLEIIGSRFHNKEEVISYFKSFYNQDAKIQKLLEEFSENTITNFPLPYCIAPNFKVNERTYLLPMVIEESSVVAAASHSAKFWHEHGGFKAEIVGVEKVGQVHFLWKDDVQLLKLKFKNLKELLISETSSITENMRKRGGGILNIELKNLQHIEPGLMQLYCTFNTMDSMGANFINSCLEQFATTFKRWCLEQPEFKEDSLDIIMCILSNLTPNCRVKCWVETEINDFDGFVKGYSGREFVQRFCLGMRVAEADPFRAVTHNKGVFNGIDAVVLATGNDFRAVEACGHAYAARNGHYEPLTKATIQDDKLKFELELPISLGVVGGLTTLHPLAKISLELLGHPSAEELMCLAAAAGLANNFSAIKSLVTVGIQEGHMKMHLLNILNQLKVPEAIRPKIVEYFKHHKVSVAETRRIYEELKIK